MTSDAQSIRIRASHIRQRLLSKNGSPYFRQTLERLSDEELLRMDAEHHKRKVQWVAEAAKKSQERF